VGTDSDSSVASGVGIALVGCGAMGGVVARRVYANRAEGRYALVAAVDTRPERAAEIAELLDIPAFDSLHSAIAAGVGIDAVDIRLPHHLHATAALAAIDLDRHVLIEKPLATSMADGTRIVEAARRHGVVAAVAENYPHLAAVRAAADAIQRGDTGPVGALRTTRAYPLGGVWTRDGWRQGGGPSAGILLDQGTHHTSLLRRLGGPIESVSASAPGNGAAAETVLLSVRFTSGQVGQSLYSWCTPAIEGEPEATVFGATARIDIGVSYDSVSGHARRYDGSTPGGVAISPAENYYDSHRLIIEDWVSSISEGRAPVVTAQDALADLAVVLAAVESLESGGFPVAVVAPPEAVRCAAT
jgi:predicted dehydrogenase